MVVSVIMRYILSIEIDRRESESSAFHTMSPLILIQKKIRPLELTYIRRFDIALYAPEMKYHMLPAPTSHVGEYAWKIYVLFGCNWRHK